MSDTKHTPGEWLAVPGRYAVFEADDKGIFKEFICWTANNKRTRTPQAAENTKILAASKDMLKALELEALADKAQDALNGRGDSDESFRLAWKILAEAGHPKTPGVHTPELIRDVRLDARKLREAALKKANGGQ